MTDKLVGVAFNQSGDAAGASFVNSESDERTVNNAVRHQYRVLSDSEKAAMVAIKDKGLELIGLISVNVPNGRCAALAITKTEEAVMWAVKGLTA